jgi:hypothetical protein
MEKIMMCRGGRAVVFELRAAAICGSIDEVVCSFSHTHTHKHKAMEPVLAVTSLAHFVAVAVRMKCEGAAAAYPLVFLFCGNCTSTCAPNATQRTPTESQRIREMQKAEKTRFLFCCCVRVNTIKNTPT